MKIYLNKKIQNECDFIFNNNTKKFSKYFLIQTNFNPLAR
jgi:hypothetical protein